MLERVADFVMGMEIGTQHVGGSAPEARRAGEDDGGAGLLAGEDGDLADQIAGPAGTTWRPWLSTRASPAAR